MLYEVITTGLEIKIMAPVEAMKYSLVRVRKGENTIAATGNVLRDYLTVVDRVDDAERRLKVA